METKDTRVSISTKGTNISHGEKKIRGSKPIITHIPLKETRPMRGKGITEEDLKVTKEMKPTPRVCTSKEVK